MVTGYEVSITTNVNINLPGPVMLPPTVTTYTFNDVPEGLNYTITVIVSNGVESNSTDLFHGKINCACLCIYILFNT